MSIFDHCSNKSLGKDIAFKLGQLYYRTVIYFLGMNFISKKLIEAPKLKNLGHIRCGKHSLFKEVRMSKYAIASLAFSIALLSTPAFANKDSEMAVAETKDVACDKARGQAEKRANESLCYSYGGLKTYSEGSCEGSKSGDKIVVKVHFEYTCNTPK